MHKVGGPWPAATTAAYVVAYEVCRQRWGLSARRFCRATEVPYPTFTRWWARWQREGNRALLDRPRRPRRSPHALPGQVLDAIRHAHRQLGWGVRRLYAYLKHADLITCSLSSVYRILRRLGIRHTRIRPRAPCLNSKLERVQRIVQEDF
jgi:transposase